MKKSATREEWLNKAVTHLSEFFDLQGLTVPTAKVSCGWPTKGAVSTRQRTLGQCFTKACSTAGVNEIFISPVLSDTSEVLAVVAHELCHAVDNCKSSHGAGFSKMMKAVGLEGKPTATHASDALKTTFKRLIKDHLGEYPHQPLDVTKGGGKKQSTRLLKAVCPQCGYTIRLTSKWAEQGMPICSVDGEVFILAKKEEGE